MELKQIEYSCFRPHADLSSSFLRKVDLLQSCWESRKNWMQSINSRPCLAATQWNSSKVKRYIPQEDICMGVIASLHAWDEKYQFYVRSSTGLRFQPVSPRYSMCAKIELLEGAGVSRLLCLRPQHQRLTAARHYHRGYLSSRQLSAISH